MIRPEYRQALVRLHLPSGPVLVAQTEAVGGHGAYPPDAAGEPITVITAHNPGGQPYPISENRAFHARLVARLGQDGLTYWPAAGGDADWTHVEESVAIPGLDLELAVALGRDFGQDAIFVWTPTDWRIVSCTDGTTIRRDWLVLPTPPG